MACLPAEGERAADKAAGRNVAYCPSGKPKLTTQETFASMQAVPPAERAKVDVRTVLRQAFAKKYPCR